MTIIHPPKPAWPGPIDGGFTQSFISRGIVCPFQLYLYAYCGLEEADKPHPNLIWGDVLHKGLEMRIRGRSLDDSIKEMYCYQLKHYPTAPSTYQYSTRNMLALYPIHTLEEFGDIETEVDIMDTLEIPQSPPYPIPPNTTIPTRPVIRRGKVDMVASNRSMIGDHKGKGKYAASPASIRAEINQDMQMNYYANAMGNIETWLYDVIIIPEALPRTPSRKVSETPEQWADRIFHTHSDMANGFPVKKNPGVWFNQVKHFQPAEDIELYMNVTIKPLIQKLCEWWDYVTDPNFDPNNPAHYNRIFYRTPVRNFNPTSTYSYNCKYHDYLIGKESFENLVPVKSFYPELEEK